jgi:tetratricopeptide (TPR) repeat protein
VRSLSRTAVRLLAGLLLVLAGAGVQAETPEEIFDRGNSAYAEGRFREAAEAYRTVLRYGIRDARVEYNLGNAEFKIGRLGRAVLHYRRAERLDPTDPDIRANLQLVESYLVDRIEDPETAAVLRVVRDLQDRVGPDAQIGSALVLFWLLAGVIAFASARPRGWNAVGGWTVAALVAALALTLVSWRITYSRLEGRELAVILDETVEVLAGPGENNAALFTIHEGTTIEIRAERGNWYQASLPNGLNGWLPKDAAGRV